MESVNRCKVINDKTHNYNTLCSCFQYSNKFYDFFSPIGWDKSYPLQPMADPGLPPTEMTRTPSIGSGLYKRNSTAGLSNLSRTNKYSGGYGPKGNYVSRNRGFSLDRMQGSRYVI